MLRKCRICSVSPAASSATSPVLILRRNGGEPLVPHRAGSGEQCDQARARQEHPDQALCAEGDGVALSIRDDGAGLPEDVRNSTGMGLHIMNYRAKMIGATLQIQRCSQWERGGHCGTVVTCKLPDHLRSMNAAEQDQGLRGRRPPHRAPGTFATDQPGARPDGLRGSRGCAHGARCHRSTRSPIF